MTAHNFASDIFGQARQITAQRRFIDDIRIEVGSVEIQHVVVIDARRIGDAAQISLVADRTADVGWRAAAFGAHEVRIANAGLRARARQERDSVLPVLTQHIVVFERAAMRQNIGERRLFGGQRGGFNVAIAQAPNPVADAEFERMAVLPADGDLQHEMQIVEADVDRHLDAARDARRHVVDFDGKPRDLVRCRRRSRHSAACWKVSISSRG